MAEQDTETQNVRQLRQALERAQAREAQWKKVALDGLVQGAGFDDKDPIVGLLVTQFNTDDLDPESLDAQAFAKFAKTYNVEPKPAVPEGQPDPAVQAQVQQMQQQTPGQPGQPVPGQPVPAQPQPAPAQQFMQQFQAPADQLLQSAAGTPTQPPSNPQQRIAAAEQAGNWEASFAEKFDLTRSIYNSTPQPVPHAGPVNDQGLPVRTPGI